MVNRKRARFGRIGIKNAFNAGHFRFVEYVNGSKHIAPRFAAHYDVTKDQASPISTNWLAKGLVSIAQTYNNLVKGDCVIASRLHQLGVTTGNESGTPALSSNPQAVKTYQRICGPGDQGCVIADVLAYAKKSGIPCGPQIHKIAGYAAVDWTNQNEVSVCAEVFGPNQEIGFNCPQSYLNAANGNNFVWDVPTPRDTVAGGHDVAIIDVTSKGVVVSTWGMWGTMTWAALITGKVQGQAMVSEMWVSLAIDWYTKGNLAPNGINATTLAADLALVAGGTTPPLPVGVNWTQIVSLLQELATILGPIGKPILIAWINTLPISATEKTMLITLINSLFVKKL